MPRNKAENTLLWDGPKRAAARVLLAHGAGAGMESPFMTLVARELAARGVGVARFEFPYMLRRRQGVRPPPDRAPVLLEAFRNAALELAGQRGVSKLVIGGKSMGGRMASMLADELGVRGLVCLGYPFHPPARPDKTRVEHLAMLKTPCLIVQGTRDTFGTQADVRQYELSAAIRVNWVEDGNHDLASRKRTGCDPVSVRARWLQEVADFINALQQ
ncbi:MAG TPA: alpha/beta family hydrolase [Polyangiales bacterium]|nr:alpha/beta family hydrolase [Polyangiales bacterium]